MTQTPKPHNVFRWLVIIILFLVVGFAILAAVQLPKDKKQLMNQPWMVSLCQHIDCSFLTTPTQHIDLNQLNLTDPILYQDHTDGVFVLRFAISNHALHAQPLPTLILRMFSTDGKQVMAKKISVSTYAANASAAPLQEKETRAFNMQLDSIPATVSRYAIEFS